MKIGILGAGQLGRMMALAGYRLDFDFVFLDPAGEPCAAPLGEHIRAPFDDASALEDFCGRIELATFEFENVPAKAAETVAARVPMQPHPRALTVGQDRLAEKQMFDRLGIPVPKYAVVGSREDLERGVAAIGFPCVLKTRRMGYDGKGQAVLRKPEDVEAAWTALGSQPLLLEAFVAFERELSCLSVRGRTGEIAFYAVTENVHRDGILRTARPSLDDPLQSQAEDYSKRLLEKLEYVGVMAFEFFVAGGRLLGNEIAPRVHNSGHWTQDGAQCCQFENHLRAIAGLPLGSTAARGPCAMVNFIGAIPDLAQLARIPGLHVHLYGKTPKPSRKVGHANLTADGAAELDAMLGRLAALTG